MKMNDLIVLFPLNAYLEKYVVKHTVELTELYSHPF